VLAIAFCGRELHGRFSTARELSVKEKFVAAECGNQHATGLRSPDMITTQDLTKNYRRNAVLRGISFSADAGAITLLVGPNGAGKTTTLKVLAGLAKPNGGSARIHSLDVARDRIRAQRTLSYLPQRPNFHPRLTCAEIMRFYARLRGIALSRCEAILDQTGLREFERVRIGELSGGTRQRLGLALLLLPDAPVLLLDEPGLSLDPTWRKRLQETLRFEAARGKTVLVTTHLVAEWNNVAHRCLLCCDGKIERELDPRNLPQNFDEIARPDSSPVYEPHFSVLH
jgi:ABC-2 type transport system ATP-binding protein